MLYKLPFQSLKSLVLIILVALLQGHPLRADPPLGRSNFVQSGAQGFGDRQNSWPWSMQWWNGRLYVGTYRSVPCVSRWSLSKWTGLTNIFPYPPVDEDYDCAPNPADLPLAAEIWRWTPATDTWERVFQSPQDIPNPDFPGKFVPAELGIRTAAVHTDQAGVEAMYLGSVSSSAMWDGVVPPPRILRTLDGANFTPVPQTPGTFLGDLSEGSLRSFAVFDGKLFGLAGDIQGNGSLIFSEDPKLGDDAWQLGAPAQERFFELHVFNGYLYVGVFAPGLGYGVVKTDAQGAPPFTFETVIQPGAFLATNPSDYVLGMHVYGGHLFVGTASFGVPAKPTELIRIAADDSWELVMGPPRQAPDGWKFPLSGIGEGFANGFNDHMWRMQSYDGRLYLGTWDSSTSWRRFGDVGPKTATMNGFDLYQTQDGWYFTPLTNNGFDDLYNEGIRNFAVTPFGLFMGAVNNALGFRVYRAQSAPVAQAAPVRLEAEPLGGKPLLYWRPAPNAAKYRVFRSELSVVNVLAGLLGQPTVQGPFQLIGNPSGTFFYDLTARSGTRYLYKVLAEGQSEVLSESSNIMQFPLLTPPPDFGVLLRVVDKLQSRGRVTPPDAQFLRENYLLAQGLAGAGSYQQAVSLMQNVRASLLNTNKVLAPDNLDMEILTDKVMRRIGLKLLVPSGSLASQNLDIRY